MNATRHAIGLGLRRGWTEFVLSLRSPQDQGFYLFMGGGTLLYLWFNRNGEITADGQSVPVVAYSLPSILAALLAFGVVIGPAYALAMEREDGTLLRHKAVPHGMQGYVTGQVLYHSLGLLPMLLVILVPSFLLFDDVMARGTSGWLTVAWVLALGLLATLPIGMVIGSLVPGVQKVGTWGMLPIIVLTAISGIFFPIQALWGWVQAVAQVFPIYWIGVGMRSAFLPDTALAFELAGSWRTGTTVLVLSAWAVAGLLVTPRVLRRMARRQSGSQVAEAREQALQWVH
ncbi:ABC transporter permease [Blastococcus sp. MG754426]|uniref:ABC transporter permease n=1 Tax=unclassified Blastococcus TaxID=2619396 RepID=UPI001EF107F6|nr:MULTISPECIES: ABC transporter permease [unclassified Blastococcus]MCF6509779.1 ABC transporter permease [Blastococcus sp. MG754426]MCF6514229.1 ABC transporter permease [Blastococcus sp. MG754427]MCF6737338.1 ABC transporter permease [Blastococcus sp. KM273129]